MLGGPGRAGVLLVDLEYGQPVSLCVAAVMPVDRASSFESEGGHLLVQLAPLGVEITLKVVSGGQSGLESDHGLGSADTRLA